MRMPEHLTLLFMHRPAILGGGQLRLRFVKTAMSIQTKAIFNTSKIGAIRESHSECVGNGRSAVYACGGLEEWPSGRTESLSNQGVILTPWSNHKELLLGLALCCLVMDTEICPPIFFSLVGKHVDYTCLPQGCSPTHVLFSSLYSMNKLLFSFINQQLAN